MRRRFGVLAALALLALAACGGSQHGDTTTARIVDDGATAVPTNTAHAPALIATATQLPATATRPAPTATRPVPTATRPVPTPTSVSPTATPTQPPPTPTPDPCPGAYAWDAAAQHVGEIVTIRGPVIDATFASDSRGKPTFLDIGKAYPAPDRFTVVIWIPNRDNFPGAPEELYAGQTVCVTGEITLYNGSPEMEIVGPEDIQSS
jgi:hypothetical protein